MSVALQNCSLVCLLTVGVVQPEREQTLLCTLCSVGVLIRSRDPLIAAMITESTICGSVMAGSLAERAGRQSGTISCPHRTAVSSASRALPPHYESAPSLVF